MNTERGFIYFNRVAGTQQQCYAPMQGGAPPQVLGEAKQKVGTSAKPQHKLEHLPRDEARRVSGREQTSKVPKSSSVDSQQPHQQHQQCSPRSPDDVRRGQHKSSSQYTAHQVEYRKLSQRINKLKNLRLQRSKRSSHLSRSASSHQLSRDDQAVSGHETKMAQLEISVQVPFEHTARAVAETRFPESTLADTIPHALLLAEYDVDEDGRFVIKQIGEPVENLCLDHWDATSQSLKQVLRVNSAFESFVCRNCPQLHDDGLEVISARGEELLHLDTTGCRNISDVGLEEIGRECPELISLRLSACVGVSDMGMTAIANGCPQLEVVEIDKSVKITDTSLTMLSYGCPSLTSVSAAYCNGITDVGIQALLNRCKTLEVLNIEGCPGFLGRAFVHMPLPFAPLIKVCGLKEINIGECVNAVSDALKWIASGCEQLQCLRARNCSNVDDSAMTVLAQQCSQLRELDISGCIKVTDMSIVFAANQMRSLEALSLSNLPHITQQAAQTFLGRCSALRRFEFASLTSTMERCIFGDDVYMRLDSLRSINLSGLCVTTDAGLGSLLACTRTKMEEIKVADCHLLTDESAYVIARMCPLLRVLDMSGCALVGDDGVKQIAQHCSDLRSLLLAIAPLADSIQKDTSLTDAGLRSLGLYCGKLEFLSVNNRTHLTGDGVRGCSLRRMRHLAANGCTRLSRRGLNAWLDACPRLRHLELSDCPMLTSADQQRCMHERPYAVSSCHALGFTPAANAQLLEFRDGYFERRHREDTAARTINAYFRNFMYKKYSVEYAALLMRRKHKLDLQIAFARKLQARFRGNIGRRLLRRHRKCMFGATEMQRIVRGYFGREKALDEIDRKEAATQIQKIIRGVLCRLTGHIFLMQKYHEVEHFKRVLKTGRLANEVELPRPKSQSLVPAGNHRKARSSRMGAFASALSAVASDVHKIDSAADARYKKQHFNKKPTPGLFEHEPRVFLENRHEVCVFGGTRNPVYDINTQAVHVFGQSFWPEGEPPAPHKDDDTGEDFRPLQHRKIDVDHDLAAAELAKEDDADVYHPAASHKFAALCEQCGKMMIAWTCVTCKEGHCNVCSTFKHSKPGMQHHELYLYRATGRNNGTGAQALKGTAARTEAVKGLLPHVKNANIASKKIQHLTKSAKTAAQLKKIQDQKQLLKELEEEEAKAKEQAAVAARVSKRRHSAATTMQSLYRGFKDRQKTAVRRVKDAKERGEAKEKARRSNVVKIQALFRGHSVVRFFEQYGRTKETIRERVDIDGNLHRWYERMTNIFRLASMKDVEEKQFELEKIFCHEKCEKLKSQFDKLQALSTDTTRQMIIMRRELAGLRTDDDAFKNNEAEVKIVTERQKHISYVLELCENGLWWATQHCRQTHRRHKACTVQSENMMTYTMWLQSEAAPVLKLRAFVEDRLTKTADTIENKYLREWLLSQKSKVVDQQIKFDTEQEAITSEETARFAAQRTSSDRGRAMVRELLSLLHMSIQYDHEKIGVELRRVKVQPDSVDGLECLQRAMVLKQKQQYSAKLVEKLRLDLESEFRKEDLRLEKVVTFAGDDESLTHVTMASIVATVNNKMKKRKVFLYQSWMDLYRSKPWLSKQMAEEARAAEKRLKDNEDLARQKDQLEKRKAEVEKTNRQIEELKKELEDLKEREENKDLTDDERRRAAMARDIKTEELEQKDADLLRREEMLKKEEHEILDTQKVLNSAEEEAEERVRRQKAADEELEARERKEEDDKAAKLKADMAALQKKQAEVLLKLAAETETERGLKDAQRDLAVAKARAEDSSLSASEKKIAEEDVEAIGQQIGVMVEQQAKCEAEHEELENQRDQLRQDEEMLKADGKRIADRDKQLQKFKEDAEQAAKDEEAAEKMKELQKQLRERKVGVAKKKVEDAKQAEKEAKFEEERKARYQKLTANDSKAEDAINSLSSARPGARDELMGAPPTLARRTGRAIASVKNKLKRREIEDPEHTQMLDSVKKRQHFASGQVEAIRSLRFTVGRDETEQFADRNSKLAAEGMPNFKKVEKGIGQYDQIWIWYEKTVDQDEFITHIELSHTDPEHEMYKDLKKSGYSKCTHERMLGKESKDPCFQIWYKRDRSSDGIGDLGVSFTEEDEQELTKDGFNQLMESLTNFNFGDMYVWYRTVERAGVVQAENSQHIVVELNEVRKMVKRNPNDENLLMMEDRLKRRLLKAQTMEDERRQNDDHPLKFAIEFLALSPREVKKFAQLFERIDTEHAGEISLGEFFHFVDEPRSLFGDRIFELQGNCNPEDGTMDFGQFLKAMGSYCFFGEQEILRFTFAQFDTDGNGFITNDELVQLLNVLHPRDSGRASRALKEVDTDGTGRIKFQEFVALHRKLPFAFHPAFRIQDSMRKAFMGVPFWEKKLKKYESVRRELRTTKSSTDTTEAKEKLKAAKAKAKAERKAARRREAQKNSSMIGRIVYYSGELGDMLW